MSFDRSGESALAQYVFDSQVQLRLSEIRANEAREKAAKEAARGADFSQRGVVALFVMRGHNRSRNGVASLAYAVHPC